MDRKIILASGSPRRKMLLEWAEIPFEVVVSDVEESFDGSMSPEKVAQHIAEKKNEAVFKRVIHEFPEAIVISADTIVVLGDEIIGKPIDEKDALRILVKLNGKTHKVITAVVIKDQFQRVAFYDETKVTFNELTFEQLEFYVQKYKPFDKAGSYAIQEWIGVVGIKKIEGDFYNVMGLPISRVYDNLKGFLHSI